MVGVGPDLLFGNWFVDSEEHGPVDRVAKDEPVQVGGCAARVGGDPAHGEVVEHEA